MTDSLGTFMEERTRAQARTRDFVNEYLDYLNLAPLADDQDPREALDSLLYEAQLVVEGLEDCIDAIVSSLIVDRRRMIPANNVVLRP
jgi:hypothetical protein